MASKKLYNKPALTYQEQLQQLKDRGLMIEDEDKALHLLANLSYYRFSAYLHPLLATPKSTHQFKPQASFEDAFTLYCFDRDLKQLIFNELEKIEVSFRARLTYIYAHEKGPFWYTNSNLFYNKSKHKITLEKITKSFEKSNAEFAKAFSKKYSNTYSPSWMALETCDFGSLSFLYSNLLPGRTRRKVAKAYGLSDNVLISWVHSFVVVRNICAHHSRLWNSRLDVKASFPQKTKFKWISTDNISNKKVYYILAMIRYMLYSINPSTSFVQKIKSLLHNYSSIDPIALGINNGSFQQNFWK